MNITEHEMRGLLAGKCLPGDMRVNEELPAYLVRKFAEAKAERDALAAENAYLLPKAASELSNAWVMHKYWVGIQAALMHMQVGRSYEAEQWLKGTIAGPELEAPNLKLSDEIDAWANEQSKDSISHSRALEIIKAETPATDAYLNSVRVDAVESFAHHQRVIADALARREEQRSHRITACRAEDFAAQLRVGKDGE
ncbi:hypothetical protein LZU96_08575 [Pantoea agglomerans]|uniref:hypothetical protein n=1 Tax=Pantoea TaxID=53335 RepID=UPI001F3CB9C4|nr:MULTISPECIES: hypothetical protein [Pantoea]UIL53965.1 hypothetical protein LZU96_08575 [Pantoea agglomerans]